MTERDFLKKSDDVIKSNKKKQTLAIFLKKITRIVQIF